MNDVSQLHDDLAVRALASVSKKWFDNRGVEPYIALEEAKRKAVEAYDKIPSWAKERPPNTSHSEAGDFSRWILNVLLDSNDIEVVHWAQQSLKEVSHPKAQVVDPATAAIWGAVLIGAILAARVKKIGPVEFYEGMPKELADFLKAVPSIFKGFTD